jgi:ATP-dependent Clp protease protease subunit
MSEYMNPKEFQRYATGHLGINSLSLHDYTNFVSNQAQGMQNMTRAVIEERPTNFREIDVFSRLMMDRIIFMGTAVDDFISNIVNAQLLFLQSTDASKDISLYVNSPGGSIYAGLGIYDTMQIVSPDISTICVGMAASMGAVLLTAGTAGKRSVLPHSRVMLHQPLGQAGGQATDIAIVNEQIQILKKELYEIIASHTGKTYEEVWEASDRDNWMRAEEALAFGVVDEILGRDKA